MEIFVALTVVIGLILLGLKYCYDEDKKQAAEKVKKQVIAKARRKELDDFMETQHAVTWSSMTAYLKNPETDYGILMASPITVKYDNLNLLLSELIKKQTQEFIAAAITYKVLNPWR